MPQKTFDDFKNKIKEKKSWSKSLTGKEMQANFIVLTYNLLLRLREKIEDNGGPIDLEIKKKQDKRWDKTQDLYRKAKRAIPLWLEKLRRTTQIGVKFIRWVRDLILQPCSWERSLELLTDEYRRK